MSLPGAMIVGILSCMPLLLLCTPRCALMRCQATLAPMPIFAYCLFGAGAYISLLNFYLSFVRLFVCRLRQREYRFVSGFPLVGSLLLVASFFCFPSDHPMQPIALIVAAFDTGGIHWFCGTLLYHGLRAVYRWGRGHKNTQNGGDRMA
jgi:hypothetical protein